MTKEGPASNDKWPPRLERLESAVTDARKRLESLGENGKDPARIKIYKDLIEKAEQAARTHRAGLPGRASTGLGLPGAIRPAHRLPAGSGRAGGLMGVPEG